MSPSVHQNQVKVRKFLHLLSHQRLHRHSTIGIVRNESDVLRLRIKSLNHADIILNIITVDKARLQFGNIQMVVKYIARFGHPAIEMLHRILRQNHHIATDQTTYHRYFDLHRIPLRQISRPRFLS